MTGSVVSVALASYNGERFIAEQLTSILSQSRRPDEIVVSDGGSGDDTVRIATEVLEREAEGIDWEIVTDGARLTVGPNFQRAIALTRGSLIALSDQDDVWHPDRLARAIAAFADADVLLASSDARLVNEAGSPLPHSLFAALGLADRDVERLLSSDAFALLIRRNLITGATVMFRRSLLEAAEPFPADWVHDEWLAIIASALGRLSVERERLIDYRQHGANVIGVSAPTFRYRLGRMLESRGGRYEVLARRSFELSARLSKVDAPLAWRELADRKAAFELARAGYRPVRLARLVPVLRQLRAGSYDELSSQGRLDVARDLLQAP
jgi:glycosyltransferase involved in cell wall biosynthesis